MTKNNPIDLPFRPPEECRILVVDDERLIVEWFTDFLGGEGYQIETAYTGEGALTAIEAGNMDMVILDVRLPDVDGIEVCNRVKQAEDTFLPIILVTGLSEKGARLDGLRAGADDFLSKPIDPLEMTARVRSLLRAKQLYDTVEENNRNLEQIVEERTQELRAAYERLQELNKVKGNILAIASHELRTPLTQAKHALSLVQQEGLTDEQEADLFRIANEAFRLLEYRTDNIALFSDPSDLNPVPVSVRDLLTSAIELVRSVRRRRDDEIILDVEPNLPAVAVDTRAMTRTLAHIIDNAVKFGEESPATITASLTTNDKILIVVEDKGMGIPEELKPELFTPLMQADDSSTRRFGGMGIGLALVKMILEAHDIPFNLESEVGKGTRFELHLELLP